MRSILSRREKQEATNAVKDINKTKDVKLHLTEEGILKWTIPELNKFIKHNTQGLPARKKLQYTNDIMKRIKTLKKKNQ